MGEYVPKSLTAEACHSLSVYIEKLSSSDLKYGPLMLNGDALRQKFAPLIREHFGAMNLPPSEEG